LTKINLRKIKTSYDTEVRIAKKLHDELANDVLPDDGYWKHTTYPPLIIKKHTLLDNRHHLFRTRNISKENSTIAMGQISF
jgi:hypothetical protein